MHFSRSATLISDNSPNSRGNLIAMKASYCRYMRHFKQPATTSRAVMRDKETFFIKLWNEENPGVFGIGECALFRGLSADDTPDYESRLADLCSLINAGRKYDLTGFGSMRFGLETALLDLAGGGRRIVFPSAWSEGRSEIEINGLVWMGNRDEMLARIDEKLQAGFKCVKLKIGGIDFDQELGLLDHIRRRFPAGELELRLDANGAFTPGNAMERLERLAVYDIHSIEQPIKPRQWEEMARVCHESPIAIALDEELIGIENPEEMRRMLHTITPKYIILKPALCGGFAGAAAWIEQAAAEGIGWWATSALESNIGLNAIAQWVSTLDVTMPQGLGTGSLYTNNIASPLVQERDVLRYDTVGEWVLPQFDWK